MNVIVGTVLGLFFFVVSYMGFRTGLRLGMQTAKGIVPPKIDPVGAITNKVTEVKQTNAQSELLKGYSNMMSYTGDLPKEGQDAGNKVY